VESTSLSATRTSCPSTRHVGDVSVAPLVRQEFQVTTASVLGYLCVLVIEGHHRWVSLRCAVLACGNQFQQGNGFALDHEHGSAPVCYQPSTCRLATGCSARGLTSLLSEKALLGAGFPLRCCQRLSLPNVATQRCRPLPTTGTPAVRPARSSRTRARPPQPSYAHGG
jgi:hypothetical protein